MSGWLRKRGGRVLATLGLLLGVAGPSHADLVMTQFLGAVKDVFEEDQDEDEPFRYPLNPGDPLTLTITYDTAAADLDPDPESGFFNFGNVDVDDIMTHPFAPPLGITMHVASSVIPVVLTFATNYDALLGIEVTRLDNGGLFLEARQFTTFVEVDRSNFLTFVGLSLEPSPLSPNLLPSRLELDTSQPSGLLLVEFFDGTDVPRFSADLFPVPEPGGATLLGLGLVTLMGYGWRRVLPGRRPGRIGT